MASSRVAVLDCGASRTVLALFARRPGNRLRLDQLAVEPLPLGPGREDEWPQLTSSACSSLRARLRYRGEVAVVLPGHLVLTKFIKTPRVDPAKRAKIIQFEAQQNLPYALNDVIWGHAIAGETEVDFEIMLCAAKHEAVEALCRGIEAAGLTPSTVTAAPLALAACQRTAQASATDSALLLEIGARTTTLVLGDARQSLSRTIALGGQAITQQIAAAQDCEFDEAEELKLSARHAEVGTAAVEAFASRLAQEVTRSALHFKRQSGAASPTRVLLTGGASRTTRLGELLATRLNVAVAVFDPLANVERASTVTESEAKEHAAILAGCVGTALMQGTPGAMRIDLRPPRLRALEDTKHRKPWLVAAAVLAAAALVPPLLHFRALEAELRAKIAQVDAEIAPLRARESANRQNLEQLGALQKQIATLQSIHDRRASWQTMLADLQERLSRVEDVWLESMEIVPAAPAAPSISVPGAATEAPPAPAPLRIAISGRMLDKTNPLSKVSDDVNRKVLELLASLADAPFVSAVEGERFDATQPGILRFDFVLVGRADRPL